jgi:hypothetical protein
MISINLIGNVISGSYGNTPFSRTYEKDIYDQMSALAVQADAAQSVEEYNKILSEFSLLTTEDLNERLPVDETFPGVTLYEDPLGRYFVKFDQGGIINIPVPQSLIDRIYGTASIGQDVTPMFKLWMRWCRNPVLRKKLKSDKGDDFSRRFFEFVDMKYVHPKLKTQLMEEHGLSEELAEQRATMYQVKITREGLINAFKVSREVLHKYDTETGEEIPRYTRTFNPDTGEIDSEGLPDIVEDRLFEPSVMGNGGDAFYCEGANGYAEPTHFIKVGCTHRLPSWDMVDCDDRHSCVPGLHVGGLKYIAWYTGEIHNVFVDPMHVGAVPDSEDGAIRCLQYFVHSSLAGVNGSMYHSSEYAKLTDEQWEEMKEQLIEEYNQIADETGEIKVL